MWVINIIQNMWSVMRRISWTIYHWTRKEKSYSAVYFGQRSIYPRTQSKSWILSTKV